MHCRNEEVRQIIKPHELVRVAIAGNKYDCFAALSLAIPVWFHHTHIVYRAIEMWELALAACLFNERRAFAETTAALIFHTESGSYLELAKKYEEIIDPILLRNIALKLAEERSRLQIKVLMHVSRTCSYASVFFRNRTWADQVIFELSATRRPGSAVAGRPRPAALKIAAVLPTRGPPACCRSDYSAQDEPRQARPAYESRAVLWPRPIPAFSRPRHTKYDNPQDLSMYLESRMPSTSRQQPPLDHEQQAYIFELFDIPGLRNRSIIDRLLVKWPSIAFVQKDIENMRARHNKKRLGGYTPT
ncbi:hypothetical protein CHGG_08779 [Chaetomium globosum CBS 148.51]|uniref:Uncharacterized protein n=1 Tax=Chaetomium globosum (strain ATCC 6205 / CBS 148.51 / DSM 1962 / NBRC 6347 / NRRL 1970) TaxID=306901 RepID=Q2GTC5_CHAGB|nr:uncharacterized protein CHGG_08779 [Chaetomium globosum CBS 148.51]EAQ84765.1 hypothetical protein CHGG_08779 [Chaetomium globosum CBS 148.51]